MVAVKNCRKDQGGESKSRIEDGGGAGKGSRRRMRMRGGISADGRTDGGKDG